MSGNEQPEQDDEDLFAAYVRERAPAPPGEYAGELQAALPFVIHSTQARYVDATVQIVGLDTPTRLVTLRFFEHGPSYLDGRIAYSFRTLMAWREALGITSHADKRAGFEGVFRELWERGQGVPLIFKIGVRAATSDRYADENIIIEVRRGYIF